MAPPPLLLLRQSLRLHRLRFHNYFYYQRLTAPTPHRLLWWSATTPSSTHPSSSSSSSSPPPEEHSNEQPSSAVTAKIHDSNFLLKAEDPPRLDDDDDVEYREWKVKEQEILRDIEPIVMLTKDILHSPRYKDGELLSFEDERAVVEKLLAYHPHYEDKIGCGIESIMVDRHPQFAYQSRGLFVVRIDGDWIHFSYHNCLREYITGRYPTHAERFIQEHFQHGNCLRKIRLYPTYA